MHIPLKVPNPILGLLGSVRVLLIGCSVLVVLFGSAVYESTRVTRPWFYYRVYSRLDREDYPGAERLLGRRLRAHPGDWYALRLYGVALLNQGRQEPGLEALRQSLALNPHQPGVSRYLREVESGGQPGAMEVP